MSEQSDMVRDGYERDPMKPVPARERAKYVTCARGHKVFVIWSDARQMFAFTCEQCNQHSDVALSEHGAVRITPVSRGRR
jgi:hypothetical protein